jgi:hypothetical protein
MQLVHGNGMNNICSQRGVLPPLKRFKEEESEIIEKTSRSTTGSTSR